METGTKQRLHTNNSALYYLMDDPSPQTIYLKDYTPSDYLIDTVSLDVNLHPTATRVRSRLEVRPNPAAARRPSTLVLDGEALKLDEVRLDGRKLSVSGYTRTENDLTIHSVPDGPFELEITTYCNPEANKALSGLYQVAVGEQDRGHLLVCLQPGCVACKHVQANKKKNDAAKPLCFALGAENVSSAIEA